MNYKHLTVARTMMGEEWDRHTPREVLQYALGGFLYTPANHPTIGRDIRGGRYPQLKSLCFCLEDSILDHLLDQAEEVLLDTLASLYNALSSGELREEALPLLFVRVRTPEQLRSIHRRMGSCGALVAGYALPKFDSANREGFAGALAEINAVSRAPVYAIPIVESEAVMHRRTREAELCGIRQTVDRMRDYVLNVRVGGNDFCNLFGLRRTQNQTIYQIGVVGDVLKDIFLTLGDAYTVSAPVWEYFSEGETESWKPGLQRELEWDKLNGFVGKTAIHPCQLETIQEAHVVDPEDYSDALTLLRWESGSAVGKSADGKRMNEVKVHQRWARKVTALARIYGVGVGRA